MSGNNSGSKNTKIWTSANIVTLLRVICIPVFIAALLSPWPAWLPYPEFWETLQPWIAALIFAIISATDAVDGHLARKRNEVTTLGKFIDPLADKILVCAALLALVELNSIPSWVALIIITREFIVSGLRMIAAAEGVILAASIYGKTKTVLQITAILLFIVKDSRSAALSDGGINAIVTMLAWLVLLAAIAMTLISMLDYFKETKALFYKTKDSKDI